MLFSSIPFLYYFLPAVLIAWFTWQDVSHLVIVSAIFACVSQFDGWVLQPRIVGSRVKMHDLTVMFSVLFWSFVIGGVVGALLAVPLTASIKVLFTRYIWSSYRKETEGSTKCEVRSTKYSIPARPVAARLF